MALLVEGYNQYKCKKWSLQQQTIFSWILPSISTVRTQQLLWSRSNFFSQIDSGLPFGQYQIIDVISYVGNASKRYQEPYLWILTRYSYGIIKSPFSLSNFEFDLIFWAFKSGLGMFTWLCSFQNRYWKVKFGKKFGCSKLNKHCEVLVSCSVRKFDNFCMEGIARKSSNHETACELLVISKNCMQANGTACRLIELHAG